MSTSRPIARPISRGLSSKAREKTEELSLLTDLPDVVFTGVSIDDTLQITAHGGGYDGASATVTTAEIESGLPLPIAPPTRLPDDGGVLSVRPGLYASSADIEYLCHWYRNDNHIGTGSSYTLTGADDGFVIQYRETPSTIHGIPLAAPYILTMQEGFSETAMTASDNATNFVLRAYDYPAQTDGKVLMFMSFEWGAEAGTVFGLSVDRCIWVEQVWNHYVHDNAGTSLFMNSRDIGTRIHLLITAEQGVIRAVNSLGDDDSIVSTTAPFDREELVQFAMFPGQTAYRGAIWDLTGGTLPDISSAAVQGKFWAGGNIIDPATSVGEYGPPILDVYGDPAFINTGNHYGSAGAGTFDFTQSSLEV